MFYICTKFSKEQHTIEMNNHNSFHKLIVVSIIIIWTIFNFQSRKKENLNYENGKSIRTGETKNGVNNGLWQWYYKNGKVQLSGNFVDGKREGVWKTFDSLGVITSSSNYVDNKLNGDLILYNEKGKVKSIKKFVDDVEVK